jgi:hypothetical protein
MLSPLHLFNGRRGDIPEILPQLTQELIELGAAILVAVARPSIEAARAATTELPIVATISKAIPAQCFCRAPD